MSDSSIATPISHELVLTRLIVAPRAALLD